MVAMHKEPIDPPLRKRRKTPKTKTGCQTCRARRIKCDEERPACNRCVASKRKCPGYETTTSQSCSRRRPAAHNVFDDSLFPLVLHPPTLPFAVTPAESNTFDYFRLHMGSGPTNMSSWLPSWARPVLQIGQKVPAVFHAITSFSAFHQWSTEGYASKSYHQRMALSESIIDARHQFAIDQYCKSIKFMREYVHGISNGDYSDAEAEICLVVCLLFLSIEIFQFENNATVHYDLAIKIIRNRASRRSKNSAAKREPTITDKSISTIAQKQEMRLQTQSITPLDSLIQTFAKMDTDLCFRGQEEPQFILNCCKIPTSFLSLDEAQVHLDVLANAVHRVRGRLMAIAAAVAEQDFPNATANDLVCLTEATSRSMDLTAHPELVKEMEHVRRNLTLYMSAFVAIPMHQRGEALMTHLKMQMHFTSIWIFSSIWRDEDESSSDRFDGQFKHMMATADRYFQVSNITSPRDSPSSATAPSDTPGPVPFTLESNIALCLFLISAKCRKSSIRKRAAKLLRRASLCGLFDSMIFAEYAERLIELEEERARDMRSDDTSCDDFDYADIPEAARIVDSTILIDKTAKTARLHFVVHPNWPESSELEVMDAEFNFDALRLS